MLEFSNSVARWPSVEWNTRPAPYIRFHTTGITTPLVHAACRPENVVVASTSTDGSMCM